MSTISSGRTISDKLVDLHVFIVPVELFLEKYRTAFNNIALESVSAGFVRVPPNDSIDRLRDHIEEQLGFDIVPEDFVYLRSVGRCMAVVKENQEQVLTIKDFMPPVAFAPEIFLLPATHDSVGRPASDVSDGVVCTQGHTTAGLNSVQPQTVHFPKIQEQYPGNPQLVTQRYTDVQHVSKQESINSSRDSYQSDIYDNGPYHQLSDGERGTEHFLQNSYDYGQNHMKEAAVAQDTRSAQEHIVSENNEVKVKRKSKRQQRTKKKNDSFDSSDGNGLESSQDSKAKHHRSVKFVQPEVVSTLPVVNSDGSSLTSPTPISNGHVVSSSPAPKKVEKTERDDSEPKIDHLSKKLEENDMKSQKHSKSNKKKNKNRSRSPSNERSIDGDSYQDGDKSMTANSSDEKNAGDRSKYSQFSSPLKGVRKPQTNEIEMASGNAEGFAIELYNEDGLWGTEGEFPDTDTQNSNSLGDQDECCSEEINNFEVEKVENTLLETENLVSAIPSEAEKEENEQLDTKKLDNRYLEADEVVGGSAIDHEKKTGAKIQSEKKENSKKKNASRKSQQNVEHIEEKFEIPKISTPPPIKLPVKAKEELEKDTASDRDRKQQEVEKLKEELRKTILERTEFEKHREHLVKKAKNVQTQTLQKRTQSKNVWKKRFFDEKRKTQPLEEQVNRLRYEVDAQHKVLMNFLEKKNQEAGSQHSIHKTPSENTNQRLMLARLQHEVEELGRRVEETKAKLASEMKLRDQAQKELKQLRKDVMDKKINVTLNRKSQKSLQTYISAENIKV